MTGRRLRVEVDRGVCIGSGMCAGSAPDLFELDGFNQSHPRREVVGGEDDAAGGDPEAAGGAEAPKRALEAAECCPVEAISLFDADSGAEVFPGP